MRDEELAMIMKNTQNLTDKELAEQLAEYYEKERKERRLITLQGFMRVVGHRTELLEIIMKENSTENIMERFELSKVQAQALMNLSVRSLVGLNRQKIEDEINALTIWLTNFHKRRRNLLSTEEQQ